jgi:hypothetical protein
MTMALAGAPPGAASFCGFCGIEKGQGPAFCLF